MSQDKPNPARMYDYYLGGYHNFEIDRQVAEKVIEVYPDAPRVAQANRAFLRRVVRFLLERGIDQFLDLGSGIPTVGNVHEVAQQADPTARVVYVDIDAVAVAQSQSILQGNCQTIAIQADIRQPAEILNDPKVRQLLDFDRPLAVLLNAVLHFVPDDAEAHAVVRTIRDALVPGSYVAISHSTYEEAPPEIVEQIDRLYADSTNPSRTRTRAQIEVFFRGLDVVEPGVVHLPRWRPEGPDDVFFDSPERSLVLGGVGRLPQN